MENLDKLKQAFADALELEPQSIRDSLSYGDKPWDSVAHMAIIAAIETVFDIMLDTEDVIDMSSFSKAKEIVAKYGVQL